MRACIPHRDDLTINRLHVIGSARKIKRNVPLRLKQIDTSNWSRESAGMRDLSEPPKT